MELFDVIHTRQSIRKFQTRAVEDEKLQRLLEAITRAPSAGNAQAYRIFVVREPALRLTLSRGAGQQACVADAPLVLVFCADPSRSAALWGAKGEQFLCLQDATVACAYAQLAATALGLASIWLGATLESEMIRDALGLRDGLWPIALLPVGYPAESPDRTSRRAVEDVVVEPLEEHSWQPLT